MSRPRMGSRRAALLATLVAVLGAPPAALAAGGDAGATEAYLRADARLAQTAAAHIPGGRAAINGVLAGVRSECPHAAAGSPQDPESTQLSNEVIGAMVTRAIRTDLPPIKAFIRAVAPLHWSNGALTATVHGYAGQLRQLVALLPPNICADVHSWAASSFATLPATTQSFSPRFMAAWVSLGEQPAALARYEGGAARSLARTAASAETQILEFEAHEVETWGTIMNALELNP